MSGKAWRKPKAKQLDRNSRKFPHQTHSYILDTNWFLALKTLQALHEAMLPNQLTILHEAAHKGQDPTEEGQLYIPVGGYQSMKHVEHVHGGKVLGLIQIDESVCLRIFSRYTPANLISDTLIPPACSNST